MFVNNSIYDSDNLSRRVSIIFRLRYLADVYKNLGKVRVRIAGGGCVIPFHRH